MKKQTSFDISKDLAVKLKGYAKYSNQSISSAFRDIMDNPINFIRKDVEKSRISVQIESDVFEKMTDIAETCMSDYSKGGINRSRLAESLLREFFKRQV